MTGQATGLFVTGNRTGSYQSRAKSEKVQSQPDFQTLLKRAIFVGSLTPDFVDVAIARPRSNPLNDTGTPARFDPVLVRKPDVEDAKAFGIDLYNIGVLKLIFAIPPDLLQHPTLSLAVDDPGTLAYVEWLDIEPDKDEASGMYRITRPARRFIRHEIIELSSISRTCHLIPEFGSRVPRSWSFDTAMLKQRAFWLNNYSDNLAFQTLY
ncbi:hypothetical protein SISNIDRAFT_489810 [Sistotremastrum niveocremeum HHB9708]|uniref:Uncharacterized protein n=1 Tax=Sistotremastrum niveocremeum HHB9708 TaxID=1314777 RepID=A0A164PJ08_9AGAM|nr:hypothetical protein SISNIDRAFT_489810 [Sistotremastrum niveocremeum HHB9708]